MDMGDVITSEQQSDPAGSREERREISWIALIRLQDGTEIPTIVKDISLSGAKLAVPESYALPERFMFKVIGRNFVCAVELAWRWGDYVGVRIEQVGKLPPSALKTVTSTTAKPTATLRARRSSFSQ